MAKRLPIEIVQSLAHQRGQDQPSPLLLMHTREARSGGRISHLPINTRLAEAWVTLTGAPFRPHQALALSALRRGEPFALAGDSAAARQSLHLLLYEILIGQPRSSVLLLAPDDASAALHLAEIQRFNALLPEAPAAAHITAKTQARAASHARIIITTADILHRRLLCRHDRAWQTFWSHLGGILLAEADSYHGIAAAQMGGLLLRSMRLVATPEPPLLGATLAPAEQADEALSYLSGLPWRIITVDDAPHPATAFALWRAGNDRLYETATLARALQFEGYSVHITCHDLDRPMLLHLLDEESEDISIGALARQVQAHIFAGYPGSHTELYRSLTGHALLTLLLLGNTPVERTLARLPESLLQEALPAWAPAPTNAYIAAQHLLCAATERPLSVAEVDAWQARSLVARLQHHSQMVRLPDDNAAWQPLASAGDPYAGFGLHTVGSAPIVLQDEQQTPLGTLDPAAFDRWGFPDAALPPGRSGYAVIERDEERGRLSVRAEHQQRRTFPLRRCEVTLRQQDAQESRTLRGRSIGWGRVMIDEEIFGYRETQPGNSPEEYGLEPPLALSWTAPALWLDLPLRLRENGQLVGWSMIAALPMRVLCQPTDMVPAYDGRARRLYLIEAQPGGNGLAAWLYENLENVLPLAYDIALDCRNDALLEPTARIDMDWLLTLLSGEFSMPTEPASSKPQGGRKQPASTPPPPQPEEAAPAERQRGDSAAEQPTEKVSVLVEEKPPEPPTLPDPPRPNTKQPRQNTPPTAPPRPEPAPEAQPAAPDPEPPAEEEPKKRRKRASSSGTAAKATAAKQSSQGSTRRKGRKAAAPPEPDQSADEQASSQNDGKTTNTPAQQAPPTPAPSAQQAPPATEPHITPPDTEAILARLQSLREKKEAATRRASPPPAPHSAAQAQFTPRFQAGEHIFCLPYGEGTVISSRMENNHELLHVDFIDHGKLDINPSVSMVRRIDAPARGSAEES